MVNNKNKLWQAVGHSQVFWIVGTIILATIAGYVSFSSSSANPNPNTTRRSDPAGFQPGKLNPDAVSQAIAFSEFPLVWLGEEFRGFKLTEFMRVQGELQDAVYLVYGDCEPQPGMEEPSCVRPLAIVVSAPGSVPEYDSTDIGDAVATGPVRTVRGVAARTLSGSEHLWTGGVVITVHANSEHMQDAVQGLRSVNHRAVGLDTVNDGDDLRALHR